MARKFGTPLDLCLNELYNVRLQNLGTTPGTTQKGQLYYDAVNNKGQLGNGTTFDDIVAQVTGTGAISVTAGHKPVVSIAASSAGSPGTMSAADFSKLAAIPADAANGTVTSVSGSGSVCGITLTGTVTTTGSLSLGGTLSVPVGNITGTLPVANGGTGVTASTGSVAVVLSTSPTLVTPILGVATATSINKVTITAPATGSTLTIADGKSLIVNSSLTMSGTGSPTTIAFGAGGTVAYTSNKLNAFAATTSAELLGIISDETGSGSLVFATSPVLVTPTLGVASATSLTTSGDVIVGGNLTVNGSVTSINSTTITVDDLTLELGSVASPTDTTANGGGLVLKGATDKSILWDSTNTNWTSTEHLNLATGHSFKINNVAVLDATTLGSSVVNSSLTKVGTVTTGTWSASFGAVSGANLTNLTAANLTGTIPAAVLGNSSVYIGTTAVALNRGTGALALVGVSIDGTSGNVTGTVTVGHGGTGATDVAGAKTALGFLTRYTTDNLVATAGQTITYTHNLNTLAVTVQVFNKSTGAQEEFDIVHATVNTITMTATAALTAGTYTIVVIG